MYISYVAIACREEDIFSLRETEEQRLQVVLHSEEGDEWGVVSLARQSKLQWGAMKAYLKIEGSQFRILVLSDSNNGIAQARWAGSDGTTSDRERITLEAGGGRLSLTLVWKTLPEAPQGGIASFESMDYGKFDACAHYLYRQFKGTGELSLLSGAIDAWGRALKVAVNRDDTASSSNFRSRALYDQYCESGNPSIVPSAINAVKAALGLTSEDDPQFADLLGDLGTYQRELFEIDRQVSGIQESVSTLRKASSIAESKNLESLPSHLTSLSLSLAKSFHFTGDLPYLEEAVEAGRRALDLTEEGDPLRSKRLFDLGLLFDARYSRERVTSDADQAISLMKRAIDTAEGNTGPYLIAALLDTLGTTLRFRFSRTNDVSDIDQALEAHRRAISMASEDDLPGFLNQLGVALDFAFYQSRDPQQIDEAVSAMRKSVALTKDGSPFLPERLRNMGVVLMSRFDYSTELKEIQEAISCFQKAVDVTPKDNALLALRLADLSNALVTRSTLTGEILDMDEAIRMRQEEIATLNEGSDRLPRALADLGQIMCRRFSMRKDVEDVLSGISAYERAIRVAPEGFNEIAFLHNLLGNAHDRAFSALGDVAHIDAATESKRRAISLLPEGHANLPLYLHNLGRSYRAKFKKDGRIETLEEAIRFQESATEKAVGRSGGLPEWYAGLADSFHMKFQATRNQVDIDRAVSVMEQALETLPSNHVDIPEREYVLGNFLIARSRLTNGEDDVKRACEHYKTSALFSHGYTSRRVEAARKWADLARAFDLKSSLDGYERAIDLISTFVGLEQTQSRRHENIAQISDLSRAAASTALEACEVTRALDWLERGRCLVWSQLSSLRTPVGDLRLVDEKLAERVIAVSKALETSGSGSGKIRVGLDKDDSGSLNSSVDLAVEWKDLVSSIREKPGFEDFLETKPFSVEDLPPRGTVVVINVHETRCDALALRTGWNAPIHIALPEISLAKAKKMADGLREYLGIGGVRLRGYEHQVEVEDEERAVRRMKRGVTEFRLVEVLRDLWKSVVHPVLDAIGYLESDAPQRVWWCPTGPLSFLPLHAAGAFRGGRDNAFDYAISSYSPNVNILLRQMRPQRTIHDTPSRILVVSQPNTPGHTPLPGTTREVMALRGVLEGGEIGHVHLEGKEATVESCAKKLGDYACVHFACHAFQDPKEPLASGFFLHDGRLELSKIIRNNLQSAELAFLSACQTSTGDDKLSEEAVHLAAGMVAAGYRGVVATMWSIKDQYAPVVATEFYTELIKPSSLGSEGGLGGTRTAEALHVAVGRLRSKLGDSEDSLLTWVPYVHFGA